MLLDLGKKTIEYIDGVEVIADRYDAFLIDVWGVLHDSARAYPGAPECLQKLKGRGKKIILLSNAARRASLLAEEFKAFGIVPSLYDQIVSSGEITWSALQTGADRRLQQLGPKYYLLGSEKYRLTEGLALQRAAEVDAADFLLAVGVAGSPQSTAAQETVLQAAAEQGLVMVCANPDLVVVRDGIMGIAPGAYAARYAELGGEVIYFGKPHRDVYRRCFSILPGINDRRIVALGDALNTDIAGAAANGLDSVLVAGGIHAQKLKNLPHNSAGLAEICRAEDNYPTMIARGFFW